MTSSPLDARVELVHDLGRLGQVLAEAARSTPPPADHRTVHIAARPGLAVAGVFGFTAHHVVVADVDHRWLRRTIGRDPFAAVSADFVAALAIETGGVAGALTPCSFCRAQARTRPPSG